MIAACFSGFALGFSLILAIGAQNAFVLRQGLRGEHVLAICTICSVSDAILIAAGVGGLGIIIDRVPWAEPLIRYGGALFLLLYAARNLYAALRGSGALLPVDRPALNFAAACLTCLLLTWANPHVYLDTLLLLGSLSSHYQGQKPAFALGAMAASGVFFFSLGYGAKLLRPFFARPASWRILDAGIGATMAILAAQMIM